ncbi:flavin reductase family protein [Agrobacterium radiobacter]|uniref:flavin reductase family protein n=1 Tax=Agrobacterium radiobacter TaxID=362 RepID=UPI003CE5BDFA
MKFNAVTAAPPLPCSPQVQAYPSRNALKDVFGRLPSGVVIVTSIAEDQPTGATVSSFSSLSFDPPLVVFGLAQKSKTLQAILHSRKFAAHIVSEPNRELALRFASDAHDKFEGLACTLSQNGVPFLPGFDASIECSLDSTQTIGDHQLLIGRVLATSINDEVSAPVAWFRRDFHSCVPFAAP